MLIIASFGTICIVVFVPSTIAGKIFWKGAICSQLNA